MSVPLANLSVRGLSEKQIPSPKKDMTKAYRQTVYTGLIRGMAAARDSAGG